MPQPTKPDTYKSALQNMMSCRPVAYYPSLARAVGSVTAALMLCQLLYWHGVKSGATFYKSVSDLLGETGLSTREQETARKLLVACGAITAQRRGWPATWHYTVDMERIAQLLAEPPQIRAFAESAERRICEPQNLQKRVNRFDKSANLTEGDNNVLNTEITPETTGEEEEGPAPQNFGMLTADLVEELLNFGVFKSKLPEVDRAGWTAAQIRQLMADCRRDDKRGTPAALLLKRLQDQKPKTNSFGYPQYNNPDEPEPPSLWDVVGNAFDQALRPIVGDGYSKIDEVIDFVDIATPYENNPDHQALLVSCPVFIWDRYIQPNSKPILEKLYPLGINSICLSQG